MAFLTITHNSGGNHGHQLKDFFGGLTIAKLFDFKYLHKKYPYLDFFATGYNEQRLTLKHKLLSKTVKIQHTSWDGMTYEVAMELFAKYQNQSYILLDLQKATRIHPCQTIAWYKNGLIKKDVFNEIVRQTTKKFYELHKNRLSYFLPSEFNIAIHIDRGKNYNPELHPMHFKSSYEVRYMFPIEYYYKIYEQIVSIAPKPYKVHIYTEKANSTAVIEAFKNEPNVILHIGSNRDEHKNELIHNIFYHFVISDLFVASNSSFSAVVTYYRYNRPMIYHVHRHLFDLPEDNFFATDDDGSFDKNQLLKKITHDNH